jgi:hypothetical protein
MTARTPAPTRYRAAYESVQARADAAREAEGGVLFDPSLSCSADVLRVTRFTYRCYEVVTIQVKFRKRIYLPFLPNLD